MEESSKIEAFIEDFLRSANLTEKDKEEFVKKYGPAMDAAKKFVENDNRLLRKGLPPLAAVSKGSSSGASISKNHAKATAIDDNFVLLENINSTWKPIKDEVTWSQLAGLEELLWSGEDSIKMYVGCVLKDVIQMLGQQHYLNAYSEIGIARIRPDWWLIRIAGRPIGVVEVKRPDKNILLKREIVGQIFDYMYNLKTYFGLKFAFGIVTTYNEWRIYWDNEAQDLSQAKVLGPITTPNVENPVEILPTPQSIELDRDIKDPSSPVFTIQRVVHASKIYNWNDPELIPALGSVILKMMHCPTIEMPKLLGRKAYIVLEPSRWFWGTLQAKVLDFEKIPSISASHFHLLQLLGRGEEGVVWLACSSTGKVCTLKFIKDPTNEKAKRKQQKELELWHQIWEISSVRIITLLDQNVMLMPFLKTYSSNDIQSNEQKEAVLEAINMMANKGYIHKDLHWRHVGYYFLDKKLKAILFDLSQVEKNNSVSNAVKKMKRALNL